MGRGFQLDRLAPGEPVVGRADHPGVGAPTLSRVALTRPGIGHDAGDQGSVREAPHGVDGVVPPGQVEYGHRLAPGPAAVAGADDVGASRLADVSGARLHRDQQIAVLQDLHAREISAGSHHHAFRLQLVHDEGLLGRDSSRKGTDDSQDKGTRTQPGVRRSTGSDLHFGLLPSEKRPRDRFMISCPMFPPLRTRTVFRRGTLPSRTAARGTAPEGSTTSFSSPMRCPTL